MCDGGADRPNSWRLGGTPAATVMAESDGASVPGSSFSSCRRMRAVQVAAMAFAMTCSGPFGVEDCVRTYGAMSTSIGIILTALLWAVPQIVMTAELSTLLPLNNGGVVSWVDRAFGRTTAAIVALNMAVYQLVDLATYPSIVVEYAQDLNYELADWIPFGMAYIVVLAGVMLNLLNIEVASTLYGWLLVLVLLPFLIGLAFCTDGCPFAARAIVGRSSAIGMPLESSPRDLNLFLSTMLWLNSGWDSMGNLAAEVSSPKALVSGLLLAAAANPIVYIAAMFGALAAGPGSWSDGYLATAYGKLWAPLELWIVSMASMANLLLYVSELACLSRLVQSLSAPSGGSHLLPCWLGWGLSNKAPAAAVIVVSVVEACLVAGLSFEFLVQLSTLLHVFALWLALAAFVQLRRRSHEAERLWTAPGGWFGCAGIVGTKAPVLVLLCVSACTDWKLACAAVLGNGGFMLLLACGASSARERQMAAGAAETLVII